MIMDRKDSITLTIRSYITPDEPLAGFIAGEPLSLDVPGGTTLAELINQIFSKKFDQIGVIAVNGKLASAETRLSPGDSIDFYPLLEGG